MRPPGRGTLLYSCPVALLNFSIGVRIAGAGDADAVVGEVVVHFGDIHFGHVARDAVLRADGAGHARVIGSFFPGGGSNVAT